MNEIIEVKQAEMLQAIDRAEVDIQIATAKQYPRDLAACLNKIETYATMDKETAEDCFYVLRRKDANGNDNIIEGLSVRMAEIIAGAWGNLRVQTRIIGNDGRMITAQAICHDLETNFAVSKEVKRRITNKYGKTYSEDMQVVTGNAAASIAFRNAVLTVIPKAVTKKIINNVLFFPNVSNWKRFFFISNASARACLKSPKSCTHVKFLIFNLFKTQRKMDNSTVYRFII